MEVSARSNRHVLRRARYLPISPPEGEMPGRAERGVILAPKSAVFITEPLIPTPRVHAGKPGHPQFPRIRQPERLVRRGNDDAALVAVRFDQAGEQCVGAGVEGRRRFVEDPDRAVGDQQLGEGEAALLAGGEVAEGEMGDAGRPTASAASSIEKGGDAARIAEKRARR
jgi:hypothetical protein